MPEVVPAEITDFRLLTGPLPGIGVDIAQRLPPVAEYMGVMAAQPPADYLDGCGIEWNSQVSIVLDLIRIQPCDLPGKVHL